MFQIDITSHVSVSSLHEDAILVGPSTASVSFPPGSALVPTLPPSIPRSQFYFWSAVWQAGEREASEDYRYGRTHRFNDPLEAVRWLLSDDN